MRLINVSLDFGISRKHKWHRGDQFFYGETVKKFVPSCDFGALKCQNHLNKQKYKN